VAEDVSAPAFAERPGKRIAELLVVCFQIADAAGGCFEAA
jgi:hypothetical protein